MLLRHCLIVLVVAALALPSGQAAKIKDVVEIVGLQENSLMGMGLVVGLPQTGDKTAAALQAMQNLLRRYRFRVTASQLASGNVALVMVTCTLPPLARKGSKIDVTVASIGDAKNLTGGVLLTTYLRALNQQVYAVAQGVLSQHNASQTTVAMISNGAIVEKEVPVSLISANGELLLRLKNPDFNTASSIAAIIEKRFGKGYCLALDMATVRIVVPQKHRQRISRFIAEVFSLEIVPETPARVVINARTGTIVIGATVTISPVTIAHNQIIVEIVADVPRQKSVTVHKLASSLLAMKVSSRELIAIFRMLKRAGALHAELIIN